MDSRRDLRLGSLESYKPRVTVQEKEGQVTPTGSSPQARRAERQIENPQDTWRTQDAAPTILLCEHQPSPALTSYMEKVRQVQFSEIANLIYSPL